VSTFLAIWVAGAGLTFFFGERNARMQPDADDALAEWPAALWICLAVWPFALICLFVSWLDGLGEEP